MKRWQPWFLIVAAAITYAMAVGPDRLQERTAEQSALDLALIYGVHRWGVAIAAVLLLTGGWAYASFWRRSGAAAGVTGATEPSSPGAARAIGRLLLAAPLLITGLGTYRVYEAWRTPVWPEMSDPRYLAIAEADFLTDTDMVLAVEVEGRAIAYPSAIVAYHHIVNDEVAGIPFVVTY